MAVHESSTERVEHLWIMGLALIAIVGSFLLQPCEKGCLCVTMPVWAIRLPMPDTCWSRSVLGISCPGCGLTRSFAAMARGEIRTALHMNPCGPLLFILCWLQIPYRALAFWNIRQTSPWLQRVERNGHVIIWIIVAALIATWLVRLL